MSQLFPGPYKIGESDYEVVASNGTTLPVICNETTTIEDDQVAAELCALLNAGWEAKQQDRPRVVCLCGSGRFKDAFDDAEFSETLAGRIVLTIGCNTKDIARTPDLEHHKPMLDELHKRKIDIANEVLVLNVGGYIGSSTRSEIDYAIAHGKPVRYLEDGGSPESRIARDLGVPVEKLHEIVVAEAKQDDHFCDVCGIDLRGEGSHWHCANCGEVSSMYGHSKIGGGFSCEKKSRPATPAEVQEVCDQMAQPQHGSVGPKLTHPGAKFDE